MPWDIRGLIEGFYGRPWSWDERCAVARFVAERGMTHYVYAPKDDPRHRERWRDPYPPRSWPASRA
ncbi:MAG: beta-N-acetylglucosaminidase domain-containing protein [Acidimicrobiales bacterium]|nr:beta-N-acetylglucosaminidase domain-containing protein [Acidimicrobiales bacterium]